MDNKIKHYSPTQSIPDVEFMPLLRGESPYYGNLNRAPLSAYNYADNVAEVLSWGGTISILQPADQVHVFKLYEIARIEDNEILVAASALDPDYSRYGIVVAEAETDSITGLMKNIIVCTFCPNFILPSVPDWYASSSTSAKLYLTTDFSADKLSTSAGSSIFGDYPVAIKTGKYSMFFSGTARLFNSWIV